MHPELREATEILAAAQVPSPQVDAELLLAHVLDCSRAELGLQPQLSAAQQQAFSGLIARRSQRVPLQHLTGTAYFRYTELQVGPGVFVPRPETELLAGWAIEKLSAIQAPLVLDLCTGSGAIAKAIATEMPSAQVIAVELDPAAYQYAEKNLAGIAETRLGDFVEAAADLLGQVDLITCNPPYIPLTAWESVVVEARDFDPELALFSGDDGLVAIRNLAIVAADLLRPGGWVGVEHADSQGAEVVQIFSSHPGWQQIRDNKDLTGRDRFTTARRELVRNKK